MPDGTTRRGIAATRRGPYLRAMARPLFRSQAEAAAQRRLKPSITTALVLGFGALMVCGMALVLGISMWSAQKNTRELLADNAELAMLSLVRETRRRLAPVEQANRYVADLIAKDRLNLSSREAIVETLLAAMAGSSQVFGMAFVYPDGTSIRVRRGVGEVPQTSSPLMLDAQLAVQEAQLVRNSFWAKPVWLQQARSTMFAVRTPIWNGDSFRGMLVSGVTVDELSRFIVGSADAPLTGNRFILFDREYVLAHRHMAEGGYMRNSDVPLPKLDEVGDAVLAQLWSTENRRRMPISLAPSTNGHVTSIGGENHIFLYRALDDFGVPLTVGIYAGPGDGLGAEFRRLLWAGIAGIGVILVFVAGAILLGRRMSAPIKALAAGSAAVADLAFDRVGRLRPSRLRELDEAARAFNRMTAGLRWFETYVPRQLVRRLVQRDAPVASEEKTVTVMFTDISGFSLLSQHMPATGVAALLNAHFTLLAECIEAEQGTVDKYIGDSVMAFWEPADGTDDVDRPLRAATAIRARIRSDNEARRSRGLVPISLRMGIHTGLAIVGNIGAPGRVNYTLVGDTVNVAARLEQLCKELVSQDDAIVLVSGDTVVRVRGEHTLTARGRYAVRGRDGEISVYSLDG
jgi:adenylate cyclase